jgi:hypothetical protein
MSATSAPSAVVPLPYFSRASRAKCPLRYSREKHGLAGVGFKGLHVAIETKFADSVIARDFSAYMRVAHVEIPYFALGSWKNRSDPSKSNGIESRALPGVRLFL